MQQHNNKQDDTRSYTSKLREMDNNMHQSWEIRSDIINAAKVDAPLEQWWVGCNMRTEISHVQYRPGCFSKTRQSACQVQGWGSTGICIFWVKHPHSSQWHPWGAISLALVPGVRQAVLVPLRQPVMCFHPPPPKSHGLSGPRGGPPITAHLSPQIRVHIPLNDNL